MNAMSHDLPNFVGVAKTPSKGRRKGMAAADCAIPTGFDTRPPLLV